MPAGSLPDVFVLCALLGRRKSTPKLRELLADVGDDSPPPGPDFAATADAALAILSETAELTPEERGAIEGWLDGFPDSARLAEALSTSLAHSAAVREVAREYAESRNRDAVRKHEGTPSWPTTLGLLLALVAAALATAPRRAGNRPGRRDAVALAAALAGASIVAPVWFSTCAVVGTLAAALVCWSIARHTGERRPLFAAHAFAASAVLAQTAELLALPAFDVVAGATGLLALGLLAAYSTERRVDQVSCAPPRRHVPGRGKWLMAQWTVVGGLFALLLAWSANELVGGTTQRATESMPSLIGAFLATIAGVLVAERNDLRAMERYASDSSTRSAAATARPSPLPCCAVWLIGSIQLLFLAADG